MSDLRYCNLYYDPNSESFLIQYRGNFKEQIDKSVIIGKTYSNEQINNAIKANENNEDPYAIVPSKDDRGHGTQVAGIIGARGYNNQFQGIASDSDFIIVKPNGETIIEVIWDQTIQSVSKDGNGIVPYGAIYMKDEINNAIKANREDKSPYEIVPSKDEIGHGTNMAGIIGGTGKNPNLKGVVPECDFIVVKIAEDIIYKDKYNTKIPIYNIFSIMTGLQFLYEYYLTNNEPIVIYFPIGTNMGNNRSTGMFSEYIESISVINGLVVVTGTGNQGDSDTHASGVISEIGKTSTVELYISPEQFNCST